jgi:hypothetical protein
MKNNNYLDPLTGEHIPYPKHTGPRQTPVMSQVFISDLIYEVKKCHHLLQRDFPLSRQIRKT